MKNSLLFIVSFDDSSSIFHIWKYKRRMRYFQWEENILLCLRVCGCVRLILWPLLSWISERRRRRDRCAVLNNVMGRVRRALDGNSFQALVELATTRQGARVMYSATRRRRRSWKWHPVIETLFFGSPATGNDSRILRIDAGSSNTTSSFLSISSQFLWRYSKVQSSAVQYTNETSICIIK